MSLYKRPGSSFWQYSFTLDGIRFRGSTGTESKREAQALEAAKRTEAKNKTKFDDDWRLRDVLGAYWHEHGQHAPSSAFIEQKLDVLSRIIGPNTKLADLTNQKLLNYKAARRGEGLQSHSINRDFNCLRAALNHAKDVHGKTIPNIAWKKVRSPEPPGRVRFLSTDEYEAILAVSDPGLQRIIKFAVATGLRKTNILTLDWRNVDLSSSLITVVVKGNKRHTVRMTAEVRAMLAMDTHRVGAVFDTVNFRKRWDRAVKLSGLDDLHFHDLRHTFASWARMAGADLADICDALAHSSVAVTMRYAHIEPAHHETAFDRVSSRVWSQNESHSTLARKK
ncbi:site-specific integrase [Novosphingobium sp. HII-3]|uniref:tyrosine-type recombinase/integrase n=1 Tax=Novosphingobium sp. HII-3 TaxID=2075565 RepID=UPI000CDAD6A1|nr:site-specific integrase [Novosphingobium sp. HII-3]